MTIYIVIKECNECDPPYRTIEYVGNEQKEADDYIKQRKSIKDRDDKNCTFNIEPWYVGTPHPQLTKGEQKEP